MIKGIIFDLDGTLIQLSINYDVIQNNLNLRHIDCGTWLYKEDGYKEKIL